MNKTAPSRVSVAMAVYNGEKYLSEQIDSIICQLSERDELIISIDPSTDLSKEIVLEYAARDNRIHVIDGPGRGVIANFSRALEHTTGQYIFLSDQDDVWEKDKIDVTLKRMSYMETQTGTDLPLLVFTDLRVVSSDMKTIAASFMRFSKLDGSRTALNQLLIQNVVTGCTVLINNILKQLALEHMTDNRVLMHDWWLSLVAASTGSICYIDVQTVKYRQHDRNIIGAKDIRSIRYLFRKIFVNNDLKQSIIQTTRQAELLAEVLGKQLSSGDRKLVEGYADMYSMGKIKRVAFMIKQKTIKFGKMRKLAQIIWG